MALAGLIAEAAKVHHKYDQKKLDEADIAYSQSLGTSVSFLFDENLLNCL